MEKTVENSNSDPLKAHTNSSNVVQFTEKKPQVKKQAEEKQMTQKVVVAEQEHQQYKVQFQAEVEELVKLNKAEETGRNDSEEKWKKMDDQTASSRLAQKRSSERYDEDLKKQQEDRDNASEHKKAAVVEKFRKKLDGLYKDPVKYADGREASIVAIIESLEAPSSSVTAPHGLIDDPRTIASTVVQLQQVDSSGRNDLGSFCLALDDNGDAWGIEGLGENSLNSNANEPWSSRKIQAWAEGFRSAKASKELNGAIEVHISKKSSLTSENANGIAKSLYQVGMEFNDTVVVCEHTHYKVQSDEKTGEAKLSAAEWSEEAQKYRTGETAIRNKGDICPITLDNIDNIDDPSLCSDGYVYSHAAIVMALDNDGGESPMTRGKVEILPTEETKDILKKIADEDQSAATPQVESSEGARRKLIEEQDKAYQESLRADQAKQAEAQSFKKTQKVTNAAATAQPVPADPSRQNQTTQDQQDTSNSSKATSNAAVMKEARNAFLDKVEDPLIDTSAVQISAVDKNSQEASASNISSPSEHPFPGEGQQVRQLGWVERAINYVYSDKKSRVTASWIKRDVQFQESQAKGKTEKYLDNLSDRAVEGKEASITKSKDSDSPSQSRPAPTPTPSPTSSKRDDEDANTVNKIADTSVGSTEVSDNSSVQGWREGVAQSDEGSHVTPPPSASSRGSSNSSSKKL